MKCSNFKYILIALLFLSVINCTSNLNNKNGIDLFDYQTLIEKDPLWNIANKDSTGFLKLQKNFWLMHFLHWRPIENPDVPLSLADVKNTIQTLWGPQMPIKLKNTNGEIIVNGHPGYYADASFNNDMIQIRMIIWNCPETNRQFISDCNINLSRGTPQKYFNIQTDEITGSICCHGGEINKNKKSTIHCTKKFISDNAQVSFYTPENWHTSEFKFITDKVPEYITPGYYPDGINIKEGSLWTLATDSEKEILFKWQPNNNNRAISESWLKEQITTLENDSSIELMDSMQVVTKMNNFTFENIEVKKNMVTCTGSFEYGYEIKELKRSDSDNYLYKAFLFEKDSYLYFLIASMVNYQSFWGVAVDLSPSESIFNDFMDNEVLYNLKR